MLKRLAAVLVLASVVVLGAARAHAYQGGALKNHVHTNAAGQGGALSSASFAPLLASSPTYTSHVSISSLTVIGSGVDFRAPSVAYSSQTFINAIAASADTGNTSFNVCRSSVTLKSYGSDVLVEASLEIGNTTAGAFVCAVLLRDGQYLSGYDAQAGACIGPYIAGYGHTLALAEIVTAPTADAYTYCVGMFTYSVGNWALYYAAPNKRSWLRARELH